MTADPGQRRYRVAVLNTHPIQYFAPLYREISETCPEIDLTVLYLSDFSLRGASDPGFGREVVWDIDLLAGYKSRFVGKNYRTSEPRGFWSLATPRIWHEIRNGNYDLLWLHGYSHAAFLIALAAARKAGTEVALRGDSQLLLYRPGLRRCLRNAVIATLFRRIQWFLAVGTRNADYYRYLGVPSARILSVPYAIDNQRFASDRCRAPGRKPVVLFAAKLIARKDPATFLHAAEILKQRRIEVTLQLAGSGPLEADLRRHARDRKLDNVDFLGFVNQSAMPALLGAADILVATSDWEPWGLIVNEAMAAGLAIIASEEMGCAPDLVRNGVNGRRISSGSPRQLADAIADLVDSRETLERLQEQSKRLVDSFSLSSAALGFARAVQQIEMARCP